MRKCIQRFGAGALGLLLAGYFFYRTAGALHDNGYLRDEYTRPTVPETFWAGNGLWLALLVCACLVVFSIVMLLLRRKRVSLTVLFCVACVAGSLFTAIALQGYEAYATEVRAAYSTSADTSPSRYGLQK